jgi:hypothetical protein
VVVGAGACDAHAATLDGTSKATEGSASADKSQCVVVGARARDDAHAAALERDLERYGGIGVRR